MTDTLNSPNSWLFDADDLQHTPSRADGISYEREMYERAFGVDLIVRVGAVRVDVPLLTIATASLFLHRFYMLNSLKQYKSREVALACLFLAGKVEESLRKVETVVNYCLRLEDRRKGKEPDVHPSSEKFKRLVQQVLFVEEVVLVALQFDLTVVHPHPLLTRALKSHEVNLSPHQMSSLGRASWQILSDIYTTPLCICHEPEILASASFLLAYSLLSDILPPLPQNWTEQFDIDWEDEEDVGEIDDVLNGVLELWSHARNEKIKMSARELKENVVKASSFLKIKQIDVKNEESTNQTMSVDEEYFTKPDTAQEASMFNAAKTAESLSTHERTNMESETAAQPASQNHDASGMEVEMPMKEYEQPPTPG